MVTHIFRLEFPIPDRNRHVPDRTLPFPIFCNTDFVFPFDIHVPDPVPGQKIWLREWFKGFSDRSRPFSSLQTTISSISLRGEMPLADRITIELLLGCRILIRWETPIEHSIHWETPIHNGILHIITSGRNL